MVLGAVYDTVLFGWTVTLTEIVLVWVLRLWVGALFQAVIHGEDAWPPLRDFRQQSLVSS